MSDLIICEECQKNNMKSTIQDNGTFSTLIGYIPFYDEEGKMHNHDNNIEFSNFECSNGHSFGSHILHSCWCGWKQEARKEF